MTFDPEKFDFEKCEDEPIHRPEAVQGFGYLIAISLETRKVEIHSENIGSLFALDDDAVFLGLDFAQALDASVVSWDFLLESYARAKSENVRLPVELRFHEHFMCDSKRLEFHAVVFSSRGLMVIEIEPASLYSESVSARQYGKIYATNVAPTFGKLKSVDEVTQAIAKSIRKLTGFERVLIYRFNEDDTGTVISESKVDDIDSYLHFHYPATDIPKQARELYRKNWIRLNPDVDTPPVNLVPAIKDTGREPLDLTQSIIRAMSPIHLQYVRNQGIRSVMSISLINQDNLWGLISCHHRDPHYVAQNIRLECESLGHLFGWQIYAKEEEVQAIANAETEETINSLIEGLGEGKDIVEIFKSKEPDVLKLMDATGFVFCSGDETVRLGQTPSEEAIEALAQRASEGFGDDPYVSARLADDLGIEPDKAACGALVIPIIPREGYFTIWFRPEDRRVIKWAGKPEEKSFDASKKDRLTPRTSFKLHEEIIEGESRQWHESDIEIARRFNRLFLRHALQRKIEMQENIDRLEVRDQVKNEFLATLAHELRNPLSPISNALTVLKMSNDREDQELAFDIADRQLKNLVTLVDDLLDVSRITRGKIRLKMEELDLKKVLVSAIEINQTLIKEEGHELVYEVAEEPLQVRGDFTRLSQCVGNILNNAAKYTGSGGRIRVAARLDDRRVVVDIEDNGLGIPKSYIDKVFDIFAQVDAGSTQTRGGLGIGLTLSKKLVELQGGTISVESEGAGKGSKFTVSFPAILKEPSTSGSSEPRSAAVSSMSGTGKRVMLVEDQVDVGRMLALLLRRKGYDVVVCRSAAEALERFEEFKPSVALLDIGLPEIDGYELCRRLQKLEGGQDAVYIAQTGWSQPERQKLSFEAGFRYHLVKPLDDSMLDATLKEAFAEKGK
ncbi:ATP-binding protein [Pelagicoccus sp. SDUM812002]|uniref:ATP-binding protein n=1 Tax=Pelagicoccus sp. SDUM812002 TaxID=3041266 RepID=UPI00280DDBEC|nr:ATP-binding protein [Pelagicoccus sp. SDUM812002]MDQ8184455.1 ATP-binding protein [Pelagicoccus sp. SDUM812002]